MSILKGIRWYRKRAYKTAKTLGDVQAVLQGRVVHRYAQRQAGKLTRRGLNKVLKSLR